MWAPGVQGAVVMRLRGGDEVRLYLVESFSFRVATPEAAVALIG